MIGKKDSDMRDRSPPSKLHTSAYKSGSWSLLTKFQGCLTNLQSVILWLLK